MKYLQKLVCIFIILLFVILCCCACGVTNNSSSDDDIVSGDNSSIDAEPDSADTLDESDEPEKEPTPIERLEEETGYQYLDYLYNDLDNRYTITFQRELVGGTYLIDAYFDIFEKDDHIILSTASIHDDILLIEISEDQYNLICQGKEGKYGRNVVIAFQMNQVSPLPVAFLSTYDYESYFKSFYNEYGEEDYDEVIDPESIYAYIYLDDNYRIIYGTCVDVFFLEDE